MGVRVIPVQFHEALLSPAHSPTVPDLPVIGLDVRSSVRHASDQQNAMPSDAGPAARHNTRHIGLPLRVNSSANTNRLERKQRVSQCDAVIDVDIGVDLEGLALGDAVVVAGRLSSSVRVVLFLGDRVERSIVPHRVQISTAAAQVSTLHCGQAIHHLLLRKIQVQVMALDEVALDLGDACKGPARSASALVLDIGDEDGRLGVIYAENCRNNIVQ